MKLFEFYPRLALVDPILGGLIAGAVSGAISGMIVSCWHSPSTSAIPRTTPLVQSGNTLQPETGHSTVGTENMENRALTLDDLRYLGDIVTNGPTGGKKIALVFDDGPVVPATEILLETLNELNIEATFCVLGYLAERHPDIITRIVREKHQVISHGWSHRSFRDLSVADLNLEIESTAEIIKELTGVSPVWVRPPAGEINSEIAAHIRSTHNQLTLLWDIDPRDWSKGRKTDEIDSEVILNAHPGAIVVLHDRVAATVEALPRIVETLSAEGYQFVTVDDLFSVRSPPEISGRERIAHETPNHR